MDTPTTNTAITGAPGNANMQEGDNPAVDTSVDSDNNDHNDTDPALDKSNNSNNPAADEHEVGSEKTKEIGLSSTTTSAQPQQQPAPVAVPAVTPSSPTAPNKAVGEEKKASDEEGEKKQQSRSESIRARLRAQERRLSSLVRNTSGDGLDVIVHMKSVQRNLEQVAAEKSQLEKELEKLKSATDHEDDFVKEKMAGIQDGFNKQVEKIKSLQEEVNAKNDEIDTLRTELVKKLQRIVELEFDLETHEIHYTTYAADQFKLGEQALEEIKRKDTGGTDDDSKSCDSSNNGSELLANEASSRSMGPRKAQKLISKLLTDLEDLERRYKEEKLRALSSLEQMRLENDDMRTEIVVLKQRLGNASDEKTSVSIEEHNIVQMRRELETAEAKKKLLIKELDKYRGKVDDLQRELSEEGKRTQLDIDLLTNDNEAMRARIAQLESKSSGGVNVFKKKKNKDDKGARFNEIESRLKETYGELARLRTSVEIKDKQISTLKQEVANLRMKDISDGNTRDTLYTEFDTELLRAAPRRIQRSPGGGYGATASESDANSDYVRDLQKQLQEIQQQLVKKDQELVIERAKAASTAAGLLARITELTGKKVDSKTSKQVPIRFYM